MKHLEDSMSHLMENRQKQIASLEEALKTSEAEKAELQQRLELQKIQVWLLYLYFEAHTFVIFINC
jgi:hypothetical protein